MRSFLYARRCLHPPPPPSPGNQQASQPVRKLGHVTVLINSENSIDDILRTNVETTLIPNCHLRGVVCTPSPYISLYIFYAYIAACYNSLWTWKNSWAYSDQLFCGWLPNTSCKSPIKQTLARSWINAAVRSQMLGKPYLNFGTTSGLHIEA